MLSSELNLTPEKITREVPASSTELIYFLLTDRFHSGNDLFISAALKDGSSHALADLIQRMGGKLKGVTSQLAYLQKLGVTAIWLSPVMENTEDGYHGYATRNFLNVDPHIGSMEDLKELVHKAHELNIRIYLDIVLNHTARVWEYAEGDPVYSSEEFSISHWKDDHHPQPYDLRNPDYYIKKGRIVNWDSYPETREGDMFELRKLRTDGSEQGKQVREILFRVYAWWIKETNADGFRIDTIKHLSPGTVAFFCDKIRAYAKSIGKKDFLLFGEAIGSYSLFRHYCKQRISEGRRIKGLDKLLDFPLHFVLPDVVKGTVPFTELLRVLKERQKFLSDMNADESMLIGFLDNHDQVAQSFKTRIHAQLDADGVLKAYALLHFICSHVQLYYGTEQGFSGEGDSDVYLREPMFDTSTALHSENTVTFRDIRQLHQWKQEVTGFFVYPLMAGAENGVLRLSRSSYREELLLLYNFDSKTQKSSLQGSETQLLWRTKGLHFSGEAELEPGAVGIFRLVR